MTSMIKSQLNQLNSLLERQKKRQMLPKNKNLSKLTNIKRGMKYTQIQLLLQPVLVKNNY